MLLIRAAFLEFLLCFHVIGAAVLFRRLFPRESPWIGFIVPVLALLSVLNFVEHYISLSNLGWLLPLTMGGLVWVIFTPGYSWEGLRFPSILFVVVFTFTYCIRCVWPDISNANEGIFNMTRVLNYCLGGTLPPKDSWLPPYDYGAYYSFQHYGAAIIKRLFSVDLGTAYNLGYAFTLAWVCLACAGVAYSISGKMWISVMTMVIVIACATGSLPYLIFYGPHDGGAYVISTNLNIDWDKPDRNPFYWLLSRDKNHVDLDLQPPLINLYWPEFHATLGGNFINIASMLALSEVFKRERSDWPWICVVVLPLVTIITSAWFFLVVGFLCGGGLILALLAGRRPYNPRFVIITIGVAIILLWPFVYAVTGISTPDGFHWTRPEEHSPLWIYAVQWWPIWLPWLFLTVAWSWLDLRGRWVVVALPLLLIAVEFLTFGDRKLTTEKMWAGIYGAGLVTLLPMIFAKKNPVLRIVSFVLIVNGLFCLQAVWWNFYNGIFSSDNILCRLQGEGWVQADVQKKRLLQVMRSLPGVTILPGLAYWNYSQAAAVVGFSENKCFVAYTFNEFHYGRGAEADFRREQTKKFYEGKIDPLPFLRGYNIDAVLIWPEDEISNQLLQQFKDQFAPEFFYVDCKMDGPNNAGLFIRQSEMEDSPLKTDNASSMDSDPR